MGGASGRSKTELGRANDELVDNNERLEVEKAHKKVIKGIESRWIVNQSAVVSGSLCFQFDSVVCTRTVN
jgi:hypothetical protein